MKLSVWAIIVNWNGKKDTDACLRSLTNVRSNDIDLHVVLVDNGSTDGSEDFIKHTHPNVTLLQAGKNLGFTGGNNLGIRHALERNADYVWLLNNDTIVDPNVLSFVDVFEDQTVGAAGSKIYFAKGREFHHDRYLPKERGHVLWYAGGLVDWNNMFASHRGVDEVDRGQYDKVEETPFITGCSFVVRSNVIRKIGVLDDSYYLYLEDLDWSIRIQRAGYKTMYAPSSKLWHVNAGSSGRPGNPTHEYYMTRNRLVFGLRWAPIRTKFALIRESIRILFGGSQLRKKAIVDAYIGRLGKQYEPKKTN